MLHSLISYPGRKIVNLIHSIGAFTVLFGQCMLLSVTPPIKTFRIFREMKRVGPGSFYIASLVAFFVGMIIALQMAYTMVKLSAELYIPNVVFCFFDT